MKAASLNRVVSESMARGGKRRAAAMTVAPRPKKGLQIFAKDSNEHARAITVVGLIY